VIPSVTSAPGGGTFQGTLFNPTINNRGDVVFVGIVETEDGVHVPNEAYIGLGAGIFRADAKGHIASVVSPGDAAPGGGTFDYTAEPWVNDGVVGGNVHINNRGDVVFSGVVDTD